MDHDEIITALAKLQEAVDRIDYAVNGNGQPGFLEKTNQRLVSLERTEAKARGALGMIVAALSAFGGTLLTHMFKGGK